MIKLKVCFIGVGSIAKRHIRNLREICEKKQIQITIDAYRRNDEEMEGVDNVYCFDSEAISDYDAVFITNPTALHFQTLKTFHNRGNNFFIEKPVVSISQIEEAKQFLTRKDAVYHVACPLRYNVVIQWIKKNIDVLDVISVRSISSSYLPDWRPGRDYRTTYSAHKELGGGVCIDLIHEWDYLTYLFGWPKIIQCLRGKKSDLEIDSDDYAIYIADYENKVVELHLDYFGRKTIREIQLFTKNDTIIGDVVNNKISFLSTGKIIDFQEERDDYQKRELNYFLDMVVGKEPIEDGYHHGLEVLYLAQGHVGTDSLRTSH